jgi:ferric-dicitrate binding protein FerR (iron transport regulator)
MLLETDFSKDYADYTAKDFLADERFVRWVRHRGEIRNLDIYWEAVIKNYPELIEEINKAADTARILACQKRFGDDANTHEAWQKVHKQLKWSAPQRVINTGKYYLLKYRNIAAITAVFVLLGGAVAGGYFLRSGSHSDEAYTTIFSPAGQKTEITLPDNSKVWLNSKTTIRYSSGFNHDNREIFLDGEAYFDVKKSRVPFEVKTSAMNLKVLGTAFNVKCYSDDSTVEATLVRGSLKVEKLNNLTGDIEEIFLTPNQKIVFVREAKESGQPLNTVEERRDEIIAGENLKSAVKEVNLIKAYNTEKSTGWIEGVLIIEGESLLELSKKIERRYDVKIIFMNEELKNFKYTGTLKEYSLEQVMRAIEATSPVSYTIDRQMVYIGEDKDEINKYLRLMKK